MILILLLAGGVLLSAFLVVCALIAEYADGDLHLSDINWPVVAPLLAAGVLAAKTILSCWPAFVY